MLPLKLKRDIQNLLNNEHYCEVKEPTLLVVDRLGIKRFSKLAKRRQKDLWQIITDVDAYVFTCSGNA